MSLSFVHSLSMTERDVFRRSQDDICARGPILIANRYFNPLTDYIPSGVIIKSWRLASSCTDDLVDGRRFENAAWRLWGEQQFKLKRISNADVDWETVLGWSASGKAASLLVPVIVSNETCHGTHEIHLLSIFHGLLPAPAPAPYWLPSLGSVPMGPTSVGETSFISIKSCFKSDTSSSRSRDSPLSFRNIPLPTSTVQQHSGARVVFNSYVEQRIILDASILGEENDSDSETDVVSELGLDNDEILLKHRSRAFDARLYSKDLGEFTDEEPTTAATKLIRCAAPKSVDFVLIQTLPPTQIFPKVEDEEHGVTVIFVPPKAHGALKEEDVLPAKKMSPPPTSKLQRTLSCHDLATFIKNEMAAIALGENGRNLTSHCDEEEEPSREASEGGKGQLLFRGRATDSQIQACAQGKTYGVRGTVETSSEEVYHGEESKEGVPSAIGTIRHGFDGEAVQANESGAGGVADADVEEVVIAVVDLGDAGFWVEQGHGEEGGETHASQAAVAGPLTVIASWLKLTVGLRFWKKQFHN